MCVKYVFEAYRMSNRHVIIMYMNYYVYVTNTFDNRNCVLLHVYNCVQCVTNES